MKSFSSQTLMQNYSNIVISICYKKYNMLLAHGKIPGYWNSLRFHRICKCIDCLRIDIKRQLVIRITLIIFNRKIGETHAKK